MIWCLWGHGCVLIEEIDTNSNWQWELDIAQKNKRNYTDHKGRKRREGEKNIYLKNTLVAYLCVFSENVVGGHFSISNPISLREPVSVAADCWSPLEPCDRAGEGTAAPYWPFIWTHGGHIATLWRNIQLITLESGLTGRERAVDC